MWKKPPRFRCSFCCQTIDCTGKWTLTNHERQCRGAEAPADVLDNTQVEEVHMLDDDADVTDPVIADDVGVVRVVHEGLHDNFDHLMQFLRNGRCVCTEDELQLIKFVFMAQGGYGTSREFSEGMLAYAKASGGKNMYLPDSWGACVDRSYMLIRRLEGRRQTLGLEVPIPQNVRVLLADPAQSHISFEFECPIIEMVRVAMFSKTCKSWENVALSFEENGGYLTDFCNGDR